MRLLPGSFWQIKEDLDPCRSYVVLEKKVGSGKIADFTEVVQALEETAGTVLETKLHRDAVNSKTFLVVEINSEAAPQVKRTLLHCKLPPDIVLYFYGDTYKKDAEA
ncbi:MAG: hypothetical protein JRJ12_14545 [Deltaproteobacteria bacterium]|nr:hypothetical protein [Deltaproteobacteria bacterium]MBW2072369.1 hypothetical protein [Deltaproteobacteria bacterium]